MYELYSNLYTFSKTATILKNVNSGPCGISTFICLDGSGASTNFKS